MLRVLLLEDERYRKESFLERLGTCQMVHVYHAHDAILNLRGPRFDLVLLDHDLNGSRYCNPKSADSGSEVARFLAANPDVRDRHGVVVVHSLNDEAAPEMASLIHGATWIPHAWGSSQWVGVKSLLDKKDTGGLLSG